MTTPVVAPRSGLNPPRAPAPTPPDTGATSKKKTKTNPTRAIHSVVARRRMTTPVVNTPPDTGAIPKEKKRRHSGIFRVADLGPGTMPRGKYPESPAPAGSHALISRTPTPGGMLQPISGCHDLPLQLSTSPPATTSKTNPTAPPQCPSRAVASRQRSRNAGGRRRLAAEIPE